MDVYLTDLRGPSEHATNQGRQAADLGGHATDQGGQAINQGGRPTGPSGRAFGPGARVKVSRARALVSFLLAKTLTGANAASQSGLRAAGGRRKGTIERTVPSRAYVRWTMFDQTFISTGSLPGGAHGVGGARRRAWVLSLARVIRRLLQRREVPQPDRRSADQRCTCRTARIDVHLQGRDHEGGRGLSGSAGAMGAGRERSPMMGRMCTSWRRVFLREDDARKDGTKARTKKHEQRKSGQATKPSQARRKVQRMIEIAQNQIEGRGMSLGLQTTT